VLDLESQVREDRGEVLEPAPHAGWSTADAAEDVVAGKLVGEGGDELSH